MSVVSDKIKNYKKRGRDLPYAKIINEHISASQNLSIYKANILRKGLLNYLDNFELLQVVTEQHPNYRLVNGVLKSGTPGLLSSVQFPSFTRLERMRKFREKYSEINDLIRLYEASEISLTQLNEAILKWKRTNSEYISTGSD